MKQFRFLGLVLLGVCFGVGVFLGSVAQAAPDSRYSVAGIENAAEFEATFLALQAAVAANDKMKVADAAIFPLRINGWVDPLTTKISMKYFSRQELIENYNEVFTQPVKDAFAKQKVADLFVNWQGVMVGKGEAWLSVTEKPPIRYGLISINLGL